MHIKKSVLRAYLAALVVPLIVGIVVGVTLDNHADLAQRSPADIVALAVAGNDIAILVLVSMVAALLLAGYAFRKLHP